MKIIKFLFLFVLVILVGLTLLGGYLGFVPFLSEVLAKQRDLGVVIDSAYFENTAKELGASRSFSSSATGTPNFLGTVEIEKSFTGSEASSIIAGWEEVYEYTRYTPFENVQIKVHEDGTLEMSAMLDVQKGINIAKEIGYTNSQIDEGLKYAKFLSNKVAFYAKGRGEVVNNQVSFEGEILELGRVKIPSNILTTVENGLEEVIETRISKIPNLRVDSMKAVDSKIDVKAQIPQMVTNAQ